MKTFKFLALTLLAGAIGFVSCDNDEVGEDGNKSYVFSPKCDFTKTNDKDAIDAQKSFIRQAFQSAGFAGEDMKLELAGKDSTAVSKLLMDKMAKVEKTLQESPVDLLSYIGVTGIEKQYADAEDEHQAYMWYEKSWKDVENLDVEQAGIYSILCEWRFVHNIRSRDWASYFTYEPESNENSVCFGGDTNYKQSSGDYIVLYLDVTHGNGHFAWDTQKANRYITDVIAIYDSKPDRIVVGNRTYHILGNVSNLNKNIKGTPTIYLYSTTDTYPGYDGYYLNAGKYNLDGELDINNCRMLVAKGNFSAASYVQPPMVVEGHRIIERPVKVYKADGTENGELDTLKGTGSSYYIRMILTYASKAATYK